MGEYAEWKRAGFGADVVLAWLPVGLSNARTWRESDYPHSTGMGWGAIGMDPDEATEWLYFNFRPETANSWRQVGVTDANNAQRLRAVMTPLDFARRRGSRTVEGMLARLRSDTPASAAPVVRTNPQDERLDSTEPRHTATEPPVPRSGDSDYDSWLRQSEAQRRGLGLTEFDDPQFLRHLFDAGLRMETRPNSVFDVHVSDDWLENILASAECVSDALTKNPDYPTTFDADDLTIVLGEVKGWIIRWVAEGNAACSCHSGRATSKCDTTDATATPNTRSDLRSAGSLTAAWYSAGLLKRKARSAFNSRPRRATLAGFWVARTVYVPRPTFQRVVDDIRVGSHEPPRAHRVQGHVRTYSDKLGRAEAEPTRQHTSDGSLDRTGRS